MTEQSFPGAKPGPKLSIYQVAGLLEKKGWNMFTGQKPAVMSLCLGVQVGGVGWWWWW